MRCWAAGGMTGLSEMLGGPRAPGIGFAIGEDRLILTLQAQAEADAAAGRLRRRAKLDAYVAPLGVAQNAAALALARELRRTGVAWRWGMAASSCGRALRWRTGWRGTL